MRRLIWDVSFRTGFELVDTQHKKLFEIANEILTNQEDNRNREIVSSVLGKLNEYIHSHFYDEEGIMKKLGYPLLNDHVDKHKKIMLSIQAAIKQNQNVPLIRQNLEELLLQWVKDHILIEDLRFSEWAKTNKLI